LSDLIGTLLKLGYYSTKLPLFVRVKRNSIHGPEQTWELETEKKKKYPSSIPKNLEDEIIPRWGGCNTHTFKIRIKERSIEISKA
jgi:hypothetical protein